jgi:alkyldihydroxyacetonephosphate synthase
MPDVETLHRELSALLGSEAVFSDDESLAAHGRDSWVLSVLAGMRGRLGRPACVARPRDTEGVAQLLRYANEHRIPLVPYGAGSGVCGGVLPQGDAIVLDLRGLDALLELNTSSLLARVQAGMMGNAFEAALNERGYTGGHFPQSIDISTVGGWVATRSSGQFSTRYGAIEDLLAALEVVLADGTVVRTRPAPRAAAGPDLRQVFLGSEGTLGVITEVTLKVMPLAASRRLTSYRFPTFSAGLEAIRGFVRDGWRPPVVRLYDQVEAARNFPGSAPETDSLLLLLSEGAESLTQAETSACAEWCERLGGSAIGSAPVEHWMSHRNSVPGFEPFLQKGIVVDTIEIAATWDRILAVYEEAVASMKKVPGVLSASAHSSHSYLTGTNLYFTFAARPQNQDDMEDAYRRCWDATMRATLAHGGTIAHHHGIGRVRREWMIQEHGAGVDVMRRIKRALDPNGILNPGVLLPP